RAINYDKTNKYNAFVYPYHKQTIIYHESKSKYTILSNNISSLHVQVSLVEISSERKIFFKYRAINYYNTNKYNAFVYTYHKQTIIYHESKSKYTILSNNIPSLHVQVSLVEISTNEKYISSVKR